MNIIISFLSGKIQQPLPVKKVEWCNSISLFNNQEHEKETKLIGAPHQLTKPKSNFLKYSWLIALLVTKLQALFTKTNKEI